MLASIREFLGIREDEQERVFLLMGMGFFIGLLTATFSVGASALFLTKFSEETDLPYAILFAGAFGIVSTYIYNQLQNRIPFWQLAGGTLLFMFTILFAIEVGTWVDPGNPVIDFSAFVLVVPFNFLTTLVFWGSFSRLFDLRQSKRIIGSIDTGQLVASLIALFSIPLLLTFINTEHLLTVSCISSVGAIAFYGPLTRRYFMRGRVFITKEVKVPIRHFFKNRYVLLMSGFIMVSMVSVTFIDFSFLNATSRQFTEQQLPTFLSYFEATVVIFSFLFQTFVTDKVIAQYGLRVALLVNPLLIGILTLGAILLGSLLGVDAADKTFVFFFIVVAMSKLFVESLKDALDGPTFKLYTLPVDSEIRLDVQTKIDGLVTSLAEFVAGALILIIGSFRDFNLLVISIITLPLLGVWFFLTSKMYNRYRLTLHETLEKNKRKVGAKVVEDYSIRAVLEKEVHGQDENKAIYGLRLMEKLEPFGFEKSIMRLGRSASAKLRSFVDALEKDLQQTTHRLAQSARTWGRTAPTSVPIGYTSAASRSKKRSASWLLSSFVIISMTKMYLSCSSCCATPTRGEGRGHGVGRKSATPRNLEPADRGAGLPQL
ncbi:MAG: hypothetical protein HC842_07740 [Cytophagales bacterium]|nr:hypothetical protein [Cytophagales bacterium]